MEAIWKPLTISWSIRSCDSQSSPTFGFIGGSRVSLTESNRRRNLRLWWERRAECPLWWLRPPPWLRTRSDRGNCRYAVGKQTNKTRIKHASHQQVTRGVTESLRRQQQLSSVIIINSINRRKEDASKRITADGTALKQPTPAIHNNKWITINGQQLIAGPYTREANRRVLSFSNPSWRG